MEGGFDSFWQICNNLRNTFGENNHGDAKPDWGNADNDANSDLARINADIDADIKSFWENFDAKPDWGKRSQTEEQSLDSASTLAHPPFIIILPSSLS